MDSADHRQHVSRLAADLAWLEEHCRRQANLTREAIQLHLAAALVRNVIGPFLDGGGRTPLHVAVVGGAGTGKSTVVNFLLGATVAEANPQAGFTRHPTAFVSSGAHLGWTGHLGFLGPLRQLTESASPSLDQDVYQVRRLDQPSSHPLGEVVIWDCPDMTTWSAEGYIGRLIEVAALADVVVYVASDERYNDEIPTRFLHLLARSGKAIVVVLTKMAAEQAPPLIEHFRREVLSRLPQGAAESIPVVTLPSLSWDILSDPAGRGANFRIPLLNQIMVALDPIEARRRTVANALRLLESAGGDLLETARRDLSAVEEWRVLVQAGRQAFDQRYRSEFLESEGFRRFDEARERLLDLLELPGAGRGVALLMKGLRLPYHAVRGLILKALVRPPAVSLGEGQVLEEAFRAWLDELRAESIRRADRHPLFRHIAVGFEGNLGAAATEQFRSLLRTFQVSSAEEIEAAARAVTAALERNPAALAVLRGLKLLLDLLAIGLAIGVGGFNWWTLLLIPIFVSLGHQLVELIVRQYVEQRRSALRSRKLASVAQHLSGPMADWLITWPVTGGSAFEKLQTVLRRVPETIAQLRGWLEPRLRS